LKIAIINRGRGKERGRRRQGDKWDANQRNSLDGELDWICPIYEEGISGKRMKNMLTNVCRSPLNAVCPFGWPASVFNGGFFVIGGNFSHFERFFYSSAEVFSGTASANEGRKNER
jgi:hypothetical protein